MRPHTCLRHACTARSRVRRGRQLHPGLGGPGEGYDWPEIEHGIYVDPKGYVWIGGNGKTDHHLLKFTKTGKFVVQIGRKGASKGNNDTENVNMAADTFVYAKTNEQTRPEIRL
jgi:hypothetical protein